MNSIGKNNYFVTFQNFARLNMAATDTGNKFANLAKIHSLVNVPPAMCVTVNFFLDALAQQPELSTFLIQYFSELQTTFGCFLVDSIQTLDQQVETFTLNRRFSNLMEGFMMEVFGDIEGIKFAVRSSARDEDTGNKSFAGLYDSVLNVSGLDEIVSAVCRVWKSYYSYPAIVARIREGSYRPFPEINVIIQKMVHSHIAGVSFSVKPNSAHASHVSDSPYIEWVSGYGEQLVSGVEDVSVYYPGSSETECPDEIEPKLSAVSQATTMLKEAFGHEIDVEWTWDDQRLYILQVRPITSILSHRNISADPYVDIHDLYSGVFLDDHEDLGECKDIYRLYVKKRAPAYMMASNHGIATGLSLVLRFNQMGIHRHIEIMEGALKQSSITEIILDVDRNIRQTIIPKNQLKDFLLKTYGNSDPQKHHTLICRDFISGDYGFISQLLPGNRLLLEASSRGLMDINRGLADCSAIICRKTGENGHIEIESFSEEDPRLAREFSIGNLSKIFCFTEAMNDSFANVKIEWVLNDKEPYFIDYSVESSGWDYLGEDTSMCRIINSGLAQGPVFRLESKSDLSRLSISPGVSVNRIDEMLKSNDLLFSLIQEIKSMNMKPIIVSKRPYAVLSYVLDDVAGFVFEGGSLLCHLSILIREAGLPALICRDVDDVLRDKKNAIISCDMIIGGD